MIEELLRTYSAQLRITEKLTGLIIDPSVVDTSFKEFLSENEFIEDIEDLLTAIKTRIEQRKEQPAEEVVSFVSVDVDNQSGLASKYGDRTMRNLSRAVGLRIQDQLEAIFTRKTDYRIYHILAGRFYLFLKGIPPEQISEDAERLRNALAGSYQIDALRISSERPMFPDGLLVLSNVTVHLGVTAYTYSELEELLLLDDSVTIVAEVRAKIILALDMLLKQGMSEGGNMVITPPLPMGKTVRSTAASRNPSKNLPLNKDQIFDEEFNRSLIEQQVFSKERRIFISHSSKDNEFAKKLANDLRQLLGDDEVWFDISGGLFGGDTWWNKIVEEVTARYIFIVVLSPDAMKSAWVRDEINLAWKQKNSKKIGKLIIPLLYRQCEVREDLDTLHNISFLSPRRYEEAFNELLRTLGLPTDGKAVEHTA